MEPITAGIAVAGVAIGNGIRWFGEQERIRIAQEAAEEAVRQGQNRNRWVTAAAVTVAVAGAAVAWNTRDRALNPEDAPMTREQAFDVLGLSPGATTGQINDAHGRVIAERHLDDAELPTHETAKMRAEVDAARNLLLEGGE